MSWQTSLIGTVLADPQTMVEAEILIPSDFSGSNKIVWAEMLALSQRNVLEARTLIETLRSHDELDGLLSDVGNSGEAVIAEYLQDRGSSITEYVSRVLDASVAKNLKRNAALIASEADGNNKTADELMDYAEKMILSLRRNRNMGETTLADLIGIFIPRLDAIRAGTFQPAWTPKITALRNVILFAERSDFIIIAARPAEGKSSLVRFEAMAHAQTGGKVAIFNLENDPIEYARNFIALDTGIDSAKLKDATKLHPEELIQVKESATRISRMPIRIFTTPGAPVSEIRRKGRQTISVDKTDMIIVDYLQLMNNGNENKVEDTTTSSSGLRALALEMQVPVIANSQLSRAIETRGVENSDPMLSDLRNSGSLEQDGTIITFIRNVWKKPTDAEIRSFPENIDEHGGTRNMLKAVPVRLHVLKNRNGPVGISDPIKWSKHTGNYQTLVRNN